MKGILTFFDKLEDKVRGKLSHYPFLYAFIGGVGIILFWRGVWNTADVLPIINNEIVSLLVGAMILMMTGVFVSDFIGNRLILTGLKGEKKLSEKTEEEIMAEEAMIEDLQSSVGKIQKELGELKKEIEERK